MLIRLNRDICMENVDIQKPRSSRHMMGGFAHDFRNFIHIIAVSANVMKKRTQDTKMLKHCEAIIDVCHMASDLVNDMVSLSKNSEDALGAININHEVLRWTSLLTKTLPEHINLEKDLGEALPVVLGKVSQIAQVIINLVKNAVDVMSGTGRICITTRKIRIHKMGCDLHPDARPGNFVTLTVSDTGPGISPHLISKIFDPFFSTKNSGNNAGLGLTMVRNIVRKHQGWIDVKSRVGQGASFILYFPTAGSERN